MTHKIVSLPQWVHAVLFGAFTLSLAVLVVNTAPMNGLPAQLLPPEYWLFTAIGMLLFLGFAISLREVVRSRRSLEEIVAGMGLIAGVTLILRLGREGWTGNMLAAMMAAVLFAAIAALLWIRKRRR